MTKNQVYWICQLLGWGLYGILQVVLYAMIQGFEANQAFGVMSQVVFFILTTHVFRNRIITWGWLNLGLARLIPRLLLFTLSLSFINYIYLLVVESITMGSISKNDLLILTILINVLGYWLLYFGWIVFYFAFFYVERYNKSLQQEAAAWEIELNNLKSQLNPHFIFNALNSIRALVDENPRKSKEAITQLSHILRNSLNADRNKLIPFQEELKMVMDYLALESIRYEERLKTTFQIHNRSNTFMVPPLMMQTLVENAIKHGIAHLTAGGHISIKSDIIDQHLIIEIRNTGQLKTIQNKTYQRGLGLVNTEKRLDLIFGDTAHFEIKNESPFTVLTRISIPKYDKDYIN